MCVLDVGKMIVYSIVEVRSLAYICKGTMGAEYEVNGWGIGAYSG